MGQGFAMCLEMYKKIRYGEGELGVDRAVRSKT